MVFYEVERQSGEVHFYRYLGNWIEGVGPGWMLDILDDPYFNVTADGYGRCIIDCSVNGKSIYRTTDYDLQMTTSVPTPLRTDGITSSAFYDLQGRRLTDKPTKGVYIQNGKKVVIKWEEWELAHISERKRARTQFKYIVK